MALLYDIEHLQNLVIVGFHVLNPTETPSIQKINIGTWQRLGPVAALTNRDAGVEMPAFQPDHLSFLMVTTFSN